MATKKSRNANDERRARGRFMDQPGQWKDTTPKSVHKRADKQAAALAKAIKKRRAK